ncbi:hypothetical protein vseg_009654 [Gypsophila vaccaria]
MEECMEIKESNESNNENNAVNDNNTATTITTTTNNSNKVEFPEGMRVLAVDDNSVCLKILNHLLNKCRYQVTSLGDKTQALGLLKRNVDNFDIVLTNVNIDEMDGFKLLEAGLELDIPVIMISASESRAIIKKGVRHGAVDYLIKPVRYEAVKTIWQHVYRKTLSARPKSGPIDEVRVDLVGTSENLKKEDASLVLVDDEGIRGDAEELGTSSMRVGKRKNSMDSDDSEDSDPTTKRERIKWTAERHQKFLHAVEILGGEDKAVPKKIRELMNLPDITREKVASHLQKYRKSIKMAREESLKRQSENHNHVLSHLLTSAPMGSMVATKLNSGGHRLMTFNNLSRGPFPSPNYLHQPNNNHWTMTQSIGSYTPALLLQQQQQQQQHRPSPLNQLIMQQQSTSMLVPVDGDYMGSVSNPLMDQQPYPQLPVDIPFESTIQVPDELFDPSPSMIDSTYEPPPLNSIYDMANEYTILYDLPEEDKKTGF